VTHEELQELLAAYALDAVSPEEREEIEAHLAECPRCQEEVAAHLQVAGVLGSLGGSAPAGLWDRIAGELSLGAGAGAGEAEESGGLGKVIQIEGAQPKGRRRFSARALVVGGVAAVLLIVIGILAARVSDLNDRVSQLQSAIVQGGVSGQVAAAMADPNHQTVPLSAAVAGKPWHAEIILDQGKAWLVPGVMPSIPSPETWQAWATVGGKFVSLGVIGNKPEEVALGLQQGMTKVLLNTEPLGGSPQPTQAVLLAGSLPSTL
jgi:anti-sigma factor RsiW